MGSSVNFRLLQDFSTKFPCDCRTIHQLFDRLWGLPPTSAHFPCGCWSFREIPSTFHSCAGHSVIIPCNRGTFHPIPSTSVKIMCLWELLKTFCVATGPSVNFRQPSVRPRDNLLSICASAGTSVQFVNFLCDRRNLRKPSVHPCDLPSTFPTSAGPSINLCRLSVYLRDHQSAICASAGPCVNFQCVCRICIKLSAYSRDLPSTSVNILCIRGPFCQLSVHPWDLPSTFRAPTGPSVNIPYGSGIFRLLLSTFCVSVGHSMKLPCVRGTSHQLSVLQRDLPSIFINFTCDRGNFLQLSVWQQDLP